MQNSSAHHIKHSATLFLDTHYHVGPIDSRLFSGFLEHLGRAIYGGVFEPGNPLSDERGFRRDVLDAVRGLRMPLVRYPGGNFVSNYDWRDGVGPRNQRPRRPEFAWKSIEPNTFGTDEFVDWCRAAGTAPMMAINLGTSGAKEAAALLEYCNKPAGTHWADQRVANGRRAPHGIKVWCLGNEMDGPWQAGHVPASEYARRAQQAAALMKGIDPTVQLVACGSSGNSMATYMDWDRQVLEYCWDHVDFISAHRYTGNRKGTPWYLAESVEIERILADYRAVIGYVRAVKKSPKQVGLSFDEWNVWYRATGCDGGWKVAPPLLEEVYNLEDALVAAMFLNAFVRNADLVKIACLAQIVNVIAPILTRSDGLLIQSIYHPCAAFASHARGHSLCPIITSPMYHAGDRGDVPVLDASVSHDDGQATAFLVNRSLTAALSVTIKFADRRITSVRSAELLTHRNPKAANTWKHPHIIKPKPLPHATLEAGRLTVRLPPLSFARISLALGKT